MYRCFIIVVFHCLAISSVVCFAEDTKKPNIVLIMADDVGCPTLGCYGGTSFKTPALDQLAKEGTRFRYCFSMPVCHPTRICLMTGRYPFRLKHPRWGSFPKAAEAETFGHMMKKAGYATAVAGKWQICMMKNDLDHPRRLGFDQWCLFAWHEGSRYYEPFLYQNGTLREDVKDRYGPDVYCEFLIEFIEKNKDRPFFAYYPMALCHDVTDDLKEPVAHGPHDRYDNYQEMIEAMDREVGKLVDALDRLKLRKNTLVLFTTDNGTPKSYIHSANENGKLIRKPISHMANGKEVRGGKGELTDAGTNVPLIANWPGVIHAGAVVDYLVDFSDFVPTLAEFAQVDVPNQGNIDGQSFAPQLCGEHTIGRQWAFAEHRGKHWVRTQRWKLYDDGRLFDVKNDPFEKKPITDESLPVRRNLEKALASLKE